MSLVQADPLQKYDLKSGKIDYSIQASGNIMGMSQISTVGKKRIIFSDYGIKKLEEEVKVEKQTVMGETKTNKTHTLMYMNGAVLYQVDFKKKIINRMKNQGMAMANALGSGKNAKETGMAMMKSMGGKKIGTDKVLGYTCDVWDLMGVKQCIYKGIPLKIESNMMGLKSVEVATKAEFDININKKSFKLPNFDVYDYDIDKMMNGTKSIMLDKSRLEEMDKQDNIEAKADAKKGAKAIQGVAAGMAALAKTGYDMKSNKKMTPEQEQVMQNAMMKAMGGEAKIVEDMKKDILKDANSEAMKFAKECFGNADTLNEVNACVDEGNAKFHEDEEHYTSWTPSEKKELIDELKQFEASIPCIKAAQTMQAMRQCMPEER
ncbi:MAG: hypothetical protein FAF03_06955 [Epsilonproteobacteria bacterium]|nr:hypothetical protein [Campylobacterota bacterium]